MKQEIRATKISKIDNDNPNVLKKSIPTPINTTKSIPTPISKSLTTPLVYTPNKMNNNDFSFISEQSQDDFRFNELINRINNQGKVNKMHIIKILGMLNKSNGMLLDDVIKKSGMSKYKCIDVLNILLKTEPPAIIKKFDKGFIYYINYD
ncbi:hypothetical protein NBO_89g0004 [Nosema bombycis CQ1]|uniref:Uncharacterized protein n=1 Tax=Nosema bombycis (strain CQ1 / CVCC 102059) TaxID=578461 RepID=R0MGL0_NOSB1|nr:hypothetical protein NBO_89g0004 [Nosema bombycis CQ1]|eukprot:EOB13260.1 hypothetical protein NBO_89g0004 [Nosema bombycis CQ1]